MKEKYWKVSHNADTTETGITMNSTYIKTIWQGFPAQQSAEEAIIEDFCFSRFGKKTAYVQGIAPCKNWYVQKSDRYEFGEARPVIWGGYPTKTIQIKIGIGDHSKVNVLYEQEVIIYNENFGKD